MKLWVKSKLIFPDIKDQIHNAEIDMALRPTYSEDASITGAWDFTKEIEILDNLLNLVLQYPFLFFP